MTPSIECERRANQRRAASPSRSKSGGIVIDSDVGLRQHHRLAPVADRVEARGQRVVEQQAADQRFADAGDQLDHLHRLQRADDAGQRADDAGLGAGRHQSGRRRLGEQVAIGGMEPPVGTRLVRLQHRDRAVEAADSGGDQRLLLSRAGIGHRIARVEIVGAVGDDVVAGGSSLGGVCRRRAASHDGSTGTCGLMRAMALAALSVLASPTACGVVDHLPLQVGQRDAVVVDDARACRRRPPRDIRAPARRARRRRSTSTRARFSLLLAGAADLRQHDVARVALQLFRRKRRRLVLCHVRNIVGSSGLVSAVGARCIHLTLRHRAVRHRQELGAAFQARKQRRPRCRS